MLEAPGETCGDALAVGPPKFVGAWANDDVVTPDVIGDMLVEAGFEAADAVERIIRVVYLG